MSPSSSSCKRRRPRQPLPGRQLRPSPEPPSSDLPVVRPCHRPTSPSGGRYVGLSTRRPQHGRPLSERCALRCEGPAQVSGRPVRARPHLSPHLAGISGPLLPPAVSHFERQRKAAQGCARLRKAAQGCASSVAGRSVPARPPSGRERDAGRRRPPQSAGRCRAGRHGRLRRSGLGSPNPRRPVAAGPGGGRGRRQPSASRCTGLRALTLSGCGRRGGARRLAFTPGAGIRATVGPQSLQR